MPRRRTFRMPIKDLLSDRFSLVLVGVFGVDARARSAKSCLFRGFLLPL